MIQDPFHDGERAAQTRAGETHTALLNSRMIADTIMQPALPFIRKQPWAILGGLDGDDRLWCSALVGFAGFAEPAPDGGEVAFDLRRAPFHPSNPLLRSLRSGQSLGSLFIEPATRRRLRVNGRVLHVSEEVLQLAVEESFPNCPKFITPRSLDAVAQAPVAPVAPGRGSALGAAERAWIAAADTLFLATNHATRGMDASHRGGAPGFVDVLDDSTLRLPDYAGNGLFQSFGNLALDARMGMLFPDFGSGALLHLSGRAEVLWDQPDPTNLTGGTGRFLQMQIEHWARTPNPLQPK